MARKTTTFDLDGKKYQFSRENFYYLIDSYKDKNNITKERIYVELEERTNTSVETIKNWVKGNNGPSDESMVDNLADYFQTDKKSLLKLWEEKPMKINYTTQQINSAKRVYDSIILLLDDCTQTMGFRSYLYSRELNDGTYYKDEYGEDNSCLYYLRNRVHKISTILAQEKFFLHDTEIYTSLQSFIDEDLTGFIEFVSKRELEELGTIIWLPVEGFNENYLAVSNKLDDVISSLI